MRFRVAVVLLCVLSIPYSNAGAAQHSVPWYEPILTHDRADWSTWTCVIRDESHSTWEHPNLGDNNAAPGGNSGIFQMRDATFHAHFGVKTLHIWQASPRQQAIAAINIRWADHDDGLNGFGAWAGDGCFG